MVTYIIIQDDQCAICSHPACISYKIGAEVYTQWQMLSNMTWDSHK